MRLLRQTMLTSCLLAIATSVVWAEDATAAPDDEIRHADLLKLLRAKADEESANSKVLEKAFRELMLKFATEHAKDMGLEAAKQIGTKESISRMVKSIRSRFPSFLKATAKQERRWEEGEFDDRATVLRAKKVIEVLQDFDATLPTVSAWAMKQIEGGKLRGAELEVATQLLMVPLAQLIQALQD